MDAKELLAELKQEGLTVTAQGDRLIVESLAGITLSQKALLQEYKPQLLKLLTQPVQDNDNAPPTMPETPEQGNTQAFPVDSEPSATEGLVVGVFTPLGSKLTVKANSSVHAEWLSRMNPKPKL